MIIKNIIIAVFLTVLFTLSTVTMLRANTYTPEQIYTIAARSAGEARLSGIDAVAYVACTIHNRLQRGYGNGTIEGVLKAYYARDFVPTNGELAIVEYYLNGDKCPSDILYALSFSDTVYLGFDRRNADYTIGTQYETTYFFSKWGNK